VPAQPLPAVVPAEPGPEAAPEFELTDRPDQSAPRAVVAAEPLTPGQRDVVYVPLAVSIGDGFKFGCGFFLASVLAALVGFVLLAALFLLMGVLGLNLPLGR
jgi:hypothetical protein